MHSIFWLLSGFTIGVAAGMLMSKPETVKADRYPKPESIKTLSRMRRIVSIILVVTSMCGLLFLAFGEIFEWRSVFLIEKSLLAHQILLIIFGFLLGLLGATKRSAIADTLDRFYRAAVGEGDHSPSILQASLAIVLLLITVFVLRPDLLSRFESIKAGEVEAKFSTIPTTSPRASEAIQFSLAEVYRQNSLNNWSNFAAGYSEGSCDAAAGKTNSNITQNVDRGSPRLMVICLLLDGKEKDLNEHRRHLSQIFFYYLTPLVQLVGCLTEHQEIIDIQRNEKLNETTILLRRYILNVSDRKIAEVALSDALTSIVQFNSSDYLRRSLDTIGVCKSAQMFKTPSIIESDAKAIAEQAYDDPTVIDPYVVALIGDMIGFFDGINEEAYFLDAVKSRYVSSSLHPGSLSLYFSIANAKLRGSSLWPYKSIIEDLEVAYKMNSDIIDKSLTAKRENPDNIPLIISSITGAYYNNKAAFDFEFMMIFADSVLHGIELDDESLAKWKQHLDDLERSMAVVDGPSSLLNITPAITSKEEGYWKEAKIDAFERFDYNSLIALSLILSNQHKTSECGSAKYYLVGAEDQIDAVADAATKQTNSNKNNDFKRAIKQRLEAYLLTFRHRIDASCAE